MPTFTHTFENKVVQGLKTSFETGLFIGGKFQDGSEGKTIDVINPTNGKLITKISEGTPKDVDAAVDAAQKAFDTTWGHKMPPHARGKLLMTLATLVEQNVDELAALETLDNGKAFSIAKGFDIVEGAACLRYYGGWADKDYGQVIDINEDKFVMTRHEPIGVVGQIIPWNFPFLMLCWKLGPALATGNAIVLKPSEFTPLTALRMCELITEAGFPPGVVNVVNGYGHVVGAAIAEHPLIRKVAFTGSTAVGRTIMKAAASTNLKVVTLELGGKSPNIIFDDAPIDLAVQWAAFGIFLNHGQTCCAGTRVFVQESIYDEFVKKYVAHTKTLKVGDPFDPSTFQGPQVSKIQYDRIMDFIEDGKKSGATCVLGGERVGDEGYFIHPTVFTNVDHQARIYKEEIFGPVVVLVKFKDEDDVIRMANDTEYGLASAIFTKDIAKAMRTAKRIHAGTVWVNCINQLHSQAPFGGFKTSGLGRELGSYALANYTEVKSVHMNFAGGPPM